MNADLLGLAYVVILILLSAAMWQVFRMINAWRRRRNDVAVKREWERREKQEYDSAVDQTLTLLRLNC
jgi:cytoskeletal protein RodZ